jgi:propanol-preferring alcohol dehydrogenase
MPLALRNIPVPAPATGEVLIRVAVCGVCHTELDEIEGRTPPPTLPMVLGHQVVGYVERAGDGVPSPRPGERVGVAWFFSSCGACRFCLAGRPNLCRQFRATGRDAPGGYAEFICAPASTYLIPPAFSDAEAAPLLCAGAVGYRALRLSAITGGQHLGLMGFGASAHLVLQLVRAIHPEVCVHVFARRAEERAFALSLGAASAGGVDDAPPELLDAIIDTTPAWHPVVAALAALDRGGRLVINAIRKEDADKPTLLDLSYERHLWQEKQIATVANVTPEDAREFLSLAATAAIHPIVQEYPLKAANDALTDLRTKPVRGARVLRIQPS